MPILGYVVNLFYQERGLIQKVKKPDFKNVEE